ncbi:PTS sugar transporter subunit IIA [Lactobacillus sp. PV037]|uniref:PTS sugar transporter subunit IIA n=1 Tax=Lactobacillus sp. PV037 TaxID=2594496 RepID=UPI002240DDD6|nr:PTS sugar transporter subunit IIA [Lactobacillus sp. PV037]QNQ84233.1 PTS sugar transporter subunit IIA [Lactobacillus sp. PV037]
MTKELFSKDAVFVSEKENQSEVFKEVVPKLQKLGLVKEDFLENLLTREDKYPTGISLRPLSRQLPNIAIPHTEGKYVNTSMIIPIALKKNIEFKNMVNPPEDLPVKFMFMILSEDSDIHAKILGDIMDFLSEQSAEDLIELFNSKTPAEVYDYLKSNFNFRKSVEAIG